MGRGSIFGLALLVLIPSAAIAQKSDQDLCAGDIGTAESRVAACTRLISSGRVKGDALADLYIYRAFEYYTHLNQNDRAIADYNQAIRLNPKSAITHRSRGNVYLRKKDYDRAIEDFSTAIRLDKKYVDAYISRGDLYHSRSEYDRAIADYSAVIRLDEKNALAFHNRGNSYHDSKDFDRAITDYSEAIRLDPKDGSGYAARSGSYAEIKDYDRALKDANGRCGSVRSWRTDTSGAAISLDRRRTSRRRSPNMTQPSV
jgi:tetratricopeptide (TPR) repeat protein